MFSQFDDYQHKCLATAAVRQGGRAGKVWAACEFASEALELMALIVSGITKSQFRPKKQEAEYVAKLEDELGDLFYGMAVVAGNMDVPLSRIVQQNLRKISARYSAGAGNVAKGDTNGGGKAVHVVEGSGRLPEKPKDPFPWASKGAKRAIKVCPKCGSETKFQEGCVSCISPGCGWAAC